MFESIEEEMKKVEESKPLRERILGYGVVFVVTVVILTVACVAIVYLG